MTIAIIKAAADYFGVAVEDITGPRRFRPIFIARAAVAYVLRHRDEMSYPQIGRRLGGRDHSSMINAMKKADEYLHADPAFAAFVGAQMERPKYDRAPVVLPSMKPQPIQFKSRQLDLPPVVAPIIAKPRTIEVIKLRGCSSFTLDDDGCTIGDRTHRFRMERGSQLLAKAVREALAA